MVRPLFALFALAVLAWPACRNQETTLRDAIERTWRMDRVFTNGQDVTQTHNAAFADYRISFTRSGGFTEQYNAFGAVPTTRTGTWEFYNDFNNIKLIETSITRFYGIVKLEDANFILTEQSGSNDNRYELKPM